ncbi:MAG: hypothetical protein IJT96_02155 [Lachnospiraceae bacterium]|nr:hypothetical protein [Lachnospiraceae bacterium]
MNILGISALYHDSAAALVCDGDIIAAAQEERFTRIKADASIPVNAISYCLSFGKKIDKVVYYDNPFLTLDRWLTNVIEAAPQNEKIIDKSFHHMMSGRLWIHEHLKKALGNKWPKGGKLEVCEHHISHGASAFYPSPFERAAILTVDGVGEWATTTIGMGDGERIEILEQTNYPDSLGLLYSAFTYYCGFKVNFGEYKLMGLAPYGEPVYEELIKKEIVGIDPDGGLHLNQKYFNYMTNDSLISDAFCELFNMQPRRPETNISKPYTDIAASIQKVTEEIMINLARKARRITGCGKLVMAGGTALNCVANGRILEDGIFDDVWIQPAAGDAGGALGCALYYGYNKAGWKRMTEGRDSQKGSYLGPSFTNDEIEKSLNDKGCKYHRYDDKKLYKKIAGYLSEGKVIGLFHGRMEYGPRALGNRSIVASALHEDMQKKLNLKIKFRESFRPFAPSVLEEDVHDYFELKTDKSPYMLLTAPVNNEIRIHENSHKKDAGIFETVNEKRSMIPAVTHVDYSARIQTVSKDANPFFYNIISAYKELTGCGLIVNTSFNVRGEPIVCSPEDAWLCFMRTDMDILVLENHILLKEEQEEFDDAKDWRSIYEPD